MNNDHLANVLSSLTNYEKLGKKLLETKENNKVVLAVLKILQEEGYLGSTQIVKDSQGDLLKINLLSRINQTNVIKPRFAIKVENLEKWEKRYLPAKDFGVIIMSTSKGLLTHKQAREQHIGGRLICYCY